MLPLYLSNNTDTPQVQSLLGEKCNVSEVSLPLLHTLRYFVSIDIIVGTLHAKAATN